ncbi:hypothetical protein N657DRAFT_690075 [Parathielavia appendiculata]|uniref:WSC domain-containing protein n=1 Tax=Parathielavia appendiculata TaxID=2587402 RepID=A0AAN6Z4E1_9PEZI|nr:hypothetical protein N657DRAFT_690075 [Parathielavia appendiculata]
MEGLKYCASKGFAVAGTEYSTAGECFCGNALSSLEKLDEQRRAQRPPSSLIASA